MLQVSKIENPVNYREQNVNLHVSHHVLTNNELRSNSRLGKASLNAASLVDLLKCFRMTTMESSVEV